MKLTDIITDKDCSVYSTSYRFCLPFTFAPSTTAAPLNRDFTRAVSFMWHRKDRRLLSQLHGEICEVVANGGLKRLHRLATLTFAWTGRPRDGLQLLADDAKPARAFPFSERTMECLLSFAPVTSPSRHQLHEAREIWSGGLGKAPDSKETKQDRVLEVGDFYQFKPKMTTRYMWSRWLGGLIDLDAGEVVKVVTNPENGMCRVSKPGDCPVFVMNELVFIEWLEPMDRRFEECQYCGAIDHETAACGYRGKIPYGCKGDFLWHIEDGKMVIDQ